ncbi:MAG: UDP-N-acetylmuramate dehydrogenase [Porphyromonas sp.]|nr:UDP-N-acetylmuramate dehydrogenase [Porphyromonas sp.]
MEIRQDQSLRKLNTFGIDASCSFLVRYDSLQDLELLQRDEFVSESKTLFIGEGSNLLFLANFHGIVLISGMKGVELRTSHDPRTVYVEVEGGLCWDEFSRFCTERGYYGTENLAMIPGTVGAAARQNIGAYGVEVSSLIEWVQAFDMQSGMSRTFTVDELRYGYRYSLFKEPDMSEWVIYRVRFKLSREFAPCLTYKDLANRFDSLPSAQELREAVVSIRRDKLPATEEVGSAGSFFMNPIVSATEMERLRAMAPDINSHVLPDGRYKLSAAWLIDQAGLKGYRDGAAGVWHKQPLVLCNYGGATGSDIGRLAAYVQQKVRDLYGVDLVPEVNYVS